MREGVCFFPGVGAEHKKGVKMSIFFFFFFFFFFKGI